ncbi:alpha-N-acetylglucosaminidase-like isoform X1 [Amphiura filiformis]|uniref:alpha-N-acetylglucosaminidase-like isoform X1 n=1 Tax=Amphiura filiformis TaxID=82378 RepID=UPI003B216D81
MPARSNTVPNRFRYYQNVCTVSYTFAFWDWSRWEQEIDWMAMNGINMPLAFNAQETIWQKVYLKLGFTQDELNAHFAGPAFLAWGRMGNMRGWGGPQPDSWYTGQLALQHQILTRMRAFGMIPVLPAFAGHVPTGITRIFPNANITRLSDWGKFDDQYCCTYFLEPSDPAFQTIGKAFIEAQMDEYNGTEHVYNGDLFNEMQPSIGDPTYLASCSKAVYDAIVAGDKDGIWLMQGWLFKKTDFWDRDRVKAYVQGVPQGKMIILDLQAENRPVYSRMDSFFGQPFIWCMLHNFGGNDGLYGMLDAINEGPFEGMKFADSTMIGTGLTPEGILQNEVVYALSTDVSWRENPVNVTQWLTDYIHSRYNYVSDKINHAWYLLQGSVYNCTDDHESHNKMEIVVRPKIKHLDPYIWYNWTQVADAWALMVQAAPDVINSTLFKYDFVDVGRQVLQDLAHIYYNNLTAAYHAKSVDKAMTYGKKMTDLLMDMDTLLCSDSHWLVGTWIEAAKALGTNDAEKKLLEFNARNQLTLWGPKGEHLDYANKQWCGLVKDYYFKRWELFVNSVVDALKSGTKFDQDDFNQKCFSTVEQPWTMQQNLYSTKPTGDTLKISQDLYNKYKGDIQASAKASIGNPVWEKAYMYKDIPVYPSHLIVHH